MVFDMSKKNPDRERTGVDLWNQSNFIIFFLDYIDNQRIDGCFVSFSLQKHPLLDKVFHLMPENVLIGGDDIVPGISETNADGKVDTICLIL